MRFFLNYEVNLIKKGKYNKAIGQSTISEQTIVI